MPVIRLSARGGCVHAVIIRKRAQEGCSRARRVERWVEPPVDPYAVGVPAAGDPVAAGITGGGGGGVIGSQALAGGGPAGI
jgi:hypothetical protein